MVQCTYEIYSGQNNYNIIITKNEDVLFSWTILAAEWEQETPPNGDWTMDKNPGLFSCKSYSEMYKQAYKKTVQNSKGLRKK